MQGEFLHCHLRPFGPKKVAWNFSRNRKLDMDSKTYLVALAMILSFHAQARPVYYNTLLSEYPKARIEQTLRCQVWHSKGRALNFYGKEVAGRFSNLSGLKSIFQQIESLDSDQDGMSNKDELLGGRNPGVADSKR